MPHDSSAQTVADRMDNEMKRAQAVVNAAAYQVIRTMQAGGDLDSMYGATLRLHLALSDLEDLHRSQMTEALSALNQDS